MDWFDPRTFYVIKGIFGVLSVSLLIIHMNTSWKTFDEDGGIGQRMRYITLFYFAVLISSVSYDQVKRSVDDISARNVGAIGGVVLLTITAIVSILEARTRKHRKFSGYSEEQREREDS